LRSHDEIDQLIVARLGKVFALHES
jgi:hypothetical protein